MSSKSSENGTRRAATKVLALGLNHNRAPIALRERLAFPPCDLAGSLTVMKRYVPEGVILSTCNRVELYAAAENIAQTEAQLKLFWSRERHVPIREFEPYLYRLRGREVSRHLFNVASGLDSVIIGEPQILGQVRQAMLQGLEQRSSGRVLSNLFRKAVRVGRQARAKTGIGRNAASISSAAVDLARRELGDLTSARVLLVGAGKMGELAARNLLDKGAAEIFVVGRRLERAQQLALRCGSAVALTQMEDALRQCDIVITCTSAPHYIIHRDMLERVMAGRGGRRLFLVDIAVPRDVQPDCADLPNVLLYNIDDLEATVAANVSVRRAEARNVRPIIAREVDDFQRWLATLRVVPTIVALRRHADAIRREELERAEGVLSRLPPDDRRRIEALTLTMQKKLLHNAIALMRAKAAAGDGFVAARAVRELFGLDGADTAAPAADADATPSRSR